MLQNLDSEQAVHHLSLWPPIYSRLAFDVNFRVRELVQMCHAILMPKVKKHLAMHIKSLVVVWLRSCFLLWKRENLPKKLFEVSTRISCTHLIAEWGANLEKWV